MKYYSAHERTKLYVVTIRKWRHLHVAVRYWHLVCLLTFNKLDKLMFIYKPLLWYLFMVCAVCLALSRVMWFYYIQGLDVVLFLERSAEFSLADNIKWHKSYLRTDLNTYPPEHLLDKLLSTPIDQCQYLNIGLTEPKAFCDLINQLLQGNFEINIEKFKLKISKYDAFLVYGIASFLCCR